MLTKQDLEVINHLIDDKIALLESTGDKPLNLFNEFQLIHQQFDKINQRFNSIDTEINELKENQQAIIGSLNHVNEQLGIK